MKYTKKTIKYFQEPHFAGEMENPDAVGQVGNIRCGDVMKIFLKIDKETIVDIKYLTYGCIGAIAASEAMCKLVKGKKIKDALKITHKDIVGELEGMPAQKVHCSVLGRQALEKAIENYKEKEVKETKNSK